MSYILDALQRAALERERASGTVPSLQTRSITAEAASFNGGAVTRHRWLFLLALIIALAIAAIGIILWPTSPVSTPVASLPAATGPVATPVAAPVAATTVATTAVVSPTASASEPIGVIPPAALPAAASTAPAKSQPAASVTAPTSAPKSAPVPSPSPAPQPSANAEPSPKATLPFLKDLPEALRAQMPPLSISGVVYSDNPAQRLLLINGQVLTQGSRAAEDLVLDEIHPRSSDFTFRGTRFKLSH
jgi:general secretion pathway protein B